MADMIMSHFVTVSHRDKAPKLTLESSHNTRYMVAAGDRAATDTSFVDSLPQHDQTVAKLAIRRLSKEIEHAKAELGELEQTVRQELAMPSVRTWLMPLMAIGLALSFYGSIAAATSAELGATGLMLLWSLGAFWYIYSREKRLEMAREANQAEIEIWSSRIEELQRSIEQNRRVLEAAHEENAETY